MDLVTGATGHLGNNLVRTLLSHGRKVRVLARASSDLDSVRDLGVEVGHGDILDPATLADSFRGVEDVYHAAALISFGPSNRKLLHEVNVEGTRNVVDACIATGVRRLVHVSSIEAFPIGERGSQLDERAGFHPEKTIMEYGRTKALGSLIVLDQVHAGRLDAVVACPTAFIGPYDYRPSHMGRLFIDFGRRKVPAGVSGGFDFVDVRDVAEGAWLACTKGRSGESYLLSGQYATVRELLSNLQRVTSIPKPRFMISGGIARGFATFAELWYRASHATPRYTRDSLRLLGLQLSVSNAKARSELGYQPRPLEATIRDTVEWFVTQGVMRLPATAEKV